MGCNCNKGQPTPMFQGGATHVAHNLLEAFKQQPNKIEWLKEGATGLVKSITGNKDYSDEDIKKNRDVCRECPHSTMKDGKLTTSSQCMAPDPTKNNAPCGCPILSKSETGKCPLNKWTHLTIKST